LNLYGANQIVKSGSNCDLNSNRDLANSPSLLHADK